VVRRRSAPREVLAASCGLAICQHYEIDAKELNAEGSRKPWRPIARLSIVSGHDFPLIFAAPNDKGGGIAFTEDIEWLEGSDDDVIILDPLVSIHQCPENDNTAIDAIVKRLARAADCKAIELVHHARKPAQGGNMEIAAADARGASALSDGVRSLRAKSRLSVTAGVACGIYNCGYQRARRLSRA
jgi:AAA domain